MKNRILLYQDFPNVKRLGVGLGWKPQEETHKRVDLDISAFLLDENLVMPTPNHIIFYHNKKSMDESILHLGDNRAGEEKKDDEIILVSLNSVEELIKEVTFVITVYNEGVEGEKNSFEPVNAAFVRLFDYQTNEEIFRYEIDERFNAFNGILFGALKKSKDGWFFEIDGSSTEKGLEGFVGKFA